MVGGGGGDKKIKEEEEEEGQAVRAWKRQDWHQTTGLEFFRCCSFSSCLPFFVYIGTSSPLSGKATHTREREVGEERESEREREREGVQAYVLWS